MVPQSNLEEDERSNLGETDVNFQRGSRKHVLDWLDLGREPFRNSLNQLLLPCDAEVTTTDCWMPVGRSSPNEARLGWNSLGVLTKEVQQKLTDWWLAYPIGANTPNWDLATSASISGKRGLVLIEAKAYEGELERAGKRIFSNQRGECNHKQIGKAINEARECLTPIAPGIQISRDRYYQVSNRIAFCWKLATLRVPVILMYLGFLNDRGLLPPLRRFEDAAQCDKLIRLYLSQVFPESCIGQRLECGEASFQVIIRSLPAFSDSAPPASIAIKA